MDKKEFITRAIAWSMFACGIPVIFIGWRYDLFKKVGTMQLSGWGIIGIIILGTFLYVLGRYIKAGFAEWSMFKQVITGIIKTLLPIGALLALLTGIRQNIDCLIQAVTCVLISEAIAIPINPFPRWVWEKTKGRFESMIDYVASKINHKEGE